MHMGGGGGDRDLGDVLRDITEHGDQVSEEVDGIRARVEFHDVMHARQDEWRKYVAERLGLLELGQRQVQRLMVREFGEIRRAQERREKRWTELIQHSCSAITTAWTSLLDVNVIRAISLLAAIILFPVAMIAFTGGLTVVGVYGLQLRYDHEAHMLEITEADVRSDDVNIQADDEP